ncbi:MAG: hypothetical protein HQK66_06765 [Desulfamplus sp.]|nr:hypothetical protein [Desulfamplus sp.]
MMKAELLEKIQSVDPSMRDVLLLMMEEFDNQSKVMTIGRSDFEELKGVVKELAVAQYRTEKRLDELTQAQTRTEKRIDELAQAQARTEKRIDVLAVRMDDLTQAQARTEKRIDVLALRMEELAQAQAKTEIAVRKLSDSVVDIRKQMGGLAMAVGYGIEDKLMPHIPKFADKVFGILADMVDRRNIVYPDGNYDEANIYVEGKKDGQPIYLIGECKSQPGKRDFDRFAGQLGRIREYKGGDVVGMMIGYHYAPDVENYAKENYPNIKFYKTFEIQRE